MLRKTSRFPLPAVSSCAGRRARVGRALRDGCHAGARQEHAIIRLQRASGGRGLDRNNPKLWVCHQQVFVRHQLQRRDAHFLQPLGGYYLGKRPEPGRGGSQASSVHVWRLAADRGTNNRVDRALRMGRHKLGPPCNRLGKRRGERGRNSATVQYRITIVDADGKVVLKDQGTSTSERMRVEPFEAPATPAATPGA